MTAQARLLSLHRQHTSLHIPEKAMVMLAVSRALREDIWRCAMSLQALFVLGQTGGCNLVFIDMAPGGKPSRNQG